MDNTFFAKFSTSELLELKAIFRMLGKEGCEIMLNEEIADRMTDQWEQDQDPIAKKAAEAVTEKTTKKAAQTVGGPKKTRKLSAEGRARIAEAQRKRWAAKKRDGESKEVASAPRKRFFNKKTREKMSRSQRKRWARERGE